MHFTLKRSLNCYGEFNKLAIEDVASMTIGIKVVVINHSFSSHSNNIRQGELNSYFTHNVPFFKGGGAGVLCDSPSALEG